MLVEAITRFRPLRQLPAWARYGLTTVIVFVCFALRFAIGHFDDPQHLPLFMLFMPAVIAASFLFDRGSGLYAVVLSAALGMYFFVAPSELGALHHAGEYLRVAAFALTGVLTAAIIEALRHVVDRLRTTIEALAAAEAKSTESLGLMTEIMEGTPDPIFIKNRNSEYVEANSAAAKVFGLTKEQIVGKSDGAFMRQADFDRAASSDREVMTTGRTMTLEEVVRGADGIGRTYLTTKSPWYSPEGEIIGLIGVARDIHDRKIMEEKLKTANAHKQLLLKDINHRVKNHLQTISSLLSLHKHRIVDATARETLEIAILQIRVLARVYDRLQLHESATKVDAGDFIEALCADLRTMILSRRSITLRSSAETVPIESSHAVLLGLAINELVTNAAKYAFPGDREGSIDIVLRQHQDEMRLEVLDDGVGLSPDALSGRGRDLVASFAHQLGGSAEWLSNDVGTHVVIRFPLSP